MQVPFRTSLESPHSLPHLALAVVHPGEPRLVQVTLRASRSAKTGARAPRFSARSRRRHGRGGRSGRRRVIAVKLPGQRFKSNEMPVAPDRVCRIRSSPVFRTVRTVESERFRAARSRPQSGGHSGQVSPIEASTSRISATASSGVTPDADPDWRRRGRARGHAGRRGPASVRMHPLLRRDL
jgi:hypothetical protein